jgi:hypothetical protein
MHNLERDPCLTVASAVGIPWSKDATHGQAAAMNHWRYFRLRWATGNLTAGELQTTTTIVNDAFSSTENNTYL